MGMKTAVYSHLFMKQVLRTKVKTIYQKEELFRRQKCMAPRHGLTGLSLIPMSPPSGNQNLKEKGKEEIRPFKHDSIY